jgi:hypothetical protein
MTFISLNSSACAHADAHISSLPPVLLSRPPTPPPPTHTHTHTHTPPPPPPPTPHRHTYAHPTHRGEGDDGKHRPCFLTDAVRTQTALSIHICFTKDACSAHSGSRTHKHQLQAMRCSPSAAQVPCALRYHRIVQHRSTRPQKFAR